MTTLAPRNLAAANPPVPIAVSLSVLAADPSPAKSATAAWAQFWLAVGLASAHILWRLLVWAEPRLGSRT
jgi:hypothetical protein